MPASLLLIQQHETDTEICIPVLIWLQILIIRVAVCQPSYYFDRLLFADR